MFHNEGAQRKKEIYYASISYRAHTGLHRDVQSPSEEPSAISKSKGPALYDAVLSR